MKSNKVKYCETFESGYYMSVLTNPKTGEIFDRRAYYLTGTTRGNKWINLNSYKPQWSGIMWNCIRRVDFELPNNLVTYHGDKNPTEFKLI